MTSTRHDRAWEVTSTAPDARTTKGGFSARRVRPVGGLFVIAVGLAVLLLLSTTTAYATTLERMSVEAMSARADRAVVGVVANVRNDFGTATSGPRTAVDIAVSDDLKGANAPVTTFYVPGGRTSSGETMFFDGMPEFRVGEQCAVFVDRNGWVMGGAQGRVPMANGRVQGGSETVAAFTSRVRGAIKGRAVKLPSTSSLSVTDPPVGAVGGVAVGTSAVPVIASISPGSASAGTHTSVTITGTGFGASQGSVNFIYKDLTTIAASVISSWSDTRITCEVPVGTIVGYTASAGSGPVTVTTSAGSVSAGYNLHVTFGYGGLSWAANNAVAPKTRVVFRVDPAGFAARTLQVTAAAATWTQAGSNFALYYGGSVVAPPVGGGSDGINELYWASSLPDGVIGQARSWGDGAGRITEADVVFSTAYSWGDGTGGTMDVQTIALHELGHWLFLRDLYGPQDNSGKVMYGYANNGLIRHSLSADDAAGIIWIYGSLVDRTAPATTARLVPSYPSIGSILLTATDSGGSGVAQTFYSLDGGASNVGVTAAVVGAGPHRLEYRSVDVAGNSETSHTLDFTLAAGSSLPVYRFYNARAGVHFYTASAAERDNVINTLGSVYRFEGPAYGINTGNAANTVPLYRFYNVRAGVHFYTASEAEKANVIGTLGSVYRYEGIAYWVAAGGSTTSPVYRFYNLRAGVHFYTASAAERDNVINTLGSVYRFEGPAFYIGN